MAEPPRTPRHPAKVLARWLVGFITDPHTRATSAAKLVGLLVTSALCAYVVISAWKLQKPDAGVCGELSALICAALALRPRATQVSQLPLTRRASDAPPIAEHAGGIA